MVGKNTLELIIAARDRTGGAFKSVKTRMKGLEGVSGKVTNALKGAAKAGALIGGAAVVAGIAGSTKAFMDFEDAMANVRKTTGFTKEQIAVLGQSINDLALRIPVAQTELANIAAVAGQLGITGQKNILAFTETAAKMSTAFDMSAESVAIAAAKLANIYDIPISQVSNLGSAINVLGNTTAASESQIMAFSMALGPAGQQLGFAATEVISLGASMISMGMDASNAGTRLNRAFTMIGQNLEELSSFMGVTTEEFTESFESMPMETFLDVIDKLSEVEGNLKANTIAANLFGEIGAKGIKSIAGNVDGLRTNLINTEREFIANTSLTEEFAAKTDTLKARFTLLKNSVTSLLIDIGGELAPTLNQVIEGVKNIIPPLKDLIFEIGGGFREMFESITRQAGSALDPLIAKVEEAGKKMSKGLNFKTLLDDVGVFIGAGLNPLIRGFTWLIDKLGPLWELIGKGAEMFHNLANALKTEEGRLDDILDATEGVTKAKQDLFDINEKLRQNTETLAEALDKAGGWTTTLIDLERDAKTETDALAVARKEATEAIAEHGAESEIAKIAIENVKIAEENAKTATNEFNTALTTASGAIIDSGVATEGLQKAQLDFIVSTGEATTKQGDLKTSIEELEKELDEAKAAPFKLGEAFTNFGKRVAAIFLELPLRVAESILKIQETIADGLAKIGLGGFADKLNASIENIKGKIATIREAIEINIEDPLLKDVPKAAEATENAITDAAHAITGAAKRTSEEIEDVKTGIEDVEDAADDAGEAGENAFEKVEITVDEATGKIEVLTKNLGETANSFTENERAAKTLLALDWDIFSKLEAELPMINSGIGNMEAAFSGLEFVLDQNITKLERVKTSVENISELSIPFLDKGFLDGIKVIGLFVNALKDASSAINAFSEIQDVSIDGCISFSLRVNDMVSALRILEEQMEDLVPAFGDMDSLITNIADAFLYSDGKMDVFTNTFSDAMTSVNDDLNATGISFDDFKKISDKALDAGFITYATQLEGGSRIWLTDVVRTIEDVESAISQSQRSLGEVVLAEDAYMSQHGFHWFDEYEGEITNWGDISTREYGDVTKAMRSFVKENYGVTVSVDDMYKVMQKTPEGQEEWFQDMARSDAALTFQMNKQTNALKSQNEQLAKITKALAPYIDFMRTLNELAALSTLSTTELNNGLGSINDTLVNLSKALSDFDLIPVMESLFGTGIENEAAGAAEGFMTTMAKHESDFISLISYIDRLSVSMATLTNAFKVFSSAEESVLSDPTALKAVFESITEVMTNFSAEVGESGFADKITKGFEEMLTSAEPLILYFRDNNAAVTEFNNTLSSFKNTLTNVVNVMGDLAEVVKKSKDQVVISSDQMVEAMAKIPSQLGEITKFLGTPLWELIVDGLRLADDAFEKFEDTIADTDFGAITSTFKDLINIMADLKSIFADVEDQVVISSDQMAAAMAKIPSQLGEIAVFLGTDVWKDVINGLNAADNAFEKFEDTIADTNFGAITSTFKDLINIMADLKSIFVDVEDQVVISSDQMVEAVRKIPSQLGEIAVFLGTDVWKDVIKGLSAADSAFAEFEGTIADTDFGAITSTFKDLINIMADLKSIFADVEDQVVISSDQMAAAMAKIPSQLGEIAVFLGTDVWKDVIKGLSAAAGGFSEFEKSLDDTLPDTEKAIDTFTTLATMVTSLSNAFLTLKDSTIISSKDMEKAIDNIKTFTVRFTEALHSNLGSLVTILTDLDAEWKIHSKVMEDVMPSFKSATGDVDTLIGTITSLSSALKAMSEMGTMTSAGFDKGFSAMINSISNFAISLKANVIPLIDTLETLREVWIDNEAALVPLMCDFNTISKSLTSVAVNANTMALAFKELRKNSGFLERGFGALIDFIKDVVENTKEFYTPEAAAELSRFISDVEKVIESFADLSSSIATAVSDIQKKVSEAVRGIETRLLNLENLNTTMFNAGVNLITSFINGLNSMKAELEVAVSDAADIIEKYLGVSSPTELGPLKDIERWPRNLVKTFSDGIGAEMGRLNTSFSDMVAPAVVADGSKGGNRTTHITIHISQKISDKTTADYAVRELERAIQRHTVI